SNPRFTDDGLRSEIWLGDGKGGFRRVPEAGIERPETVISALFVDYDRDGRLDLFTGASYTAYGKSLEAFPDRLYRGKGDGRFVEVTKQAGLLGVAAWGRADSRRPTYGVAHTDWNNDGWQDLLTMSYGRQWNRLWRNNGDGTFTDLAPQTGFDGDAIRDGRYPPIVRRPTERPFRANGNTFDAAVADYDNDGDMDVFLAEITHWWAGPSSDRSMLLENLGPEHGYRFRRRPDLIPRTHFAERWNQGDMHAGWLDVDNDGLLDLVIASSDYPDLQRLQLYHQRPDHTFEDWSERLGLTWRNAAAISFADFDGDGGVDIAVTTNNHRLTREQRRSHPLAMGLLRNLEARRTGHHWIELRLRGAGAGKANRDAIGARVVLWTGDRRQTREVYGGQGHAGHRDDTTLHFGLGEARHADRIEVHWPDASGSVQRFEHVAADRLYLLEQGGRLRTIHR
ncbi:MAG: CRTAC1 family protein, partial [Planctomycetota bacterium]